MKRKPAVKPKGCAHKPTERRFAMVYFEMPKESVWPVQRFEWAFAECKKCRVVYRVPEVKR